MKYKGLEVFDVIFDDNLSLFNNVAIVTEPAIEENFIRLSKEDDIDIMMSIDEEKHIVTGPVLIPNQLIYRNQGGRKFYIRYSKETIEQMAINFFKNHRNTEGNVEHQIPVNGITFFESYILNKERGIVPKEFESLPDGTWMMSAKVNNDNVWDAIKSGELNGFSIDISNIDLREEQSKVLDTIEDLFEYLKNN